MDKVPPGLQKLLQLQMPNAIIAMHHVMRLSKKWEYYPRQIVNMLK